VGWRAGNLQYKDGKGVVRNLDVIVKTVGNLPGGGNFVNGATSSAAVSDRIFSGEGKVDAISVYVQPNAPSDALSHEMGHAADRVSDDKGQMRSYYGTNGIEDIHNQSKSAPDCRTNPTHPRVAPARDAEDNFNRNQ
jgi:hypothetical protein